MRQRKNPWLRQTDRNAEECLLFILKPCIRRGKNLYNWKWETLSIQDKWPSRIFLIVRLKVSYIRSQSIQQRGFVSIDIAYRGKEHMVYVMG